MDEFSKHDPVVVIKSDARKPSFLKRLKAPFSKFSSPNKKIASAILTLLLIFGVGAGVYIGQRPTQFRPQATDAGVNLSLQPSTVQTNADEQFVVDVVADTQSNKMSAAHVRITYDPESVVLVNTALDSYLPVVLQQATSPSQANGVVEFVVGSQADSPPQGTGKIATVTFRALKNSGSTQINIDQQTTQVAVVGQSTNKIGTLSNATVNFTTPTQDNQVVMKVAVPPEYAAGQEAIIGDVVPVRVAVGTPNEAANLFVAKISFPKDKLKVVSIDKENSFIVNWTEEFFDNNTGQISLVGGVPTPGHKTNPNDTPPKDTLAHIRFEVIDHGTATIDILGTSEIYSNSTNQNILQKTKNTTLNIQAPAGESPSPSPSAEVSPSPSASPSSSPSPSASAENCNQKGEANNDCLINLKDLSILLTNFSALNSAPAGKEALDFNNDGKINTFDFSAMSDKLFQLGVIRRRS